jgi:hypothetical protein
MHPRLEHLQHFRLPRSSTEAVTAVIILIGSLYLTYLTFFFQRVTQAGYAGGTLFPQIALGLLVFCSCKLLADWFLERRRTTATPDADVIELDLTGFVPVVLLVIAYALLLSTVQFEIGTFALMIVLLGPRIGLRHAIWVSALTTLVVYAVFALVLDVDFPLLFLPSHWPF